jgi:hypothetical protein
MKNIQKLMTILELDHPSWALLQFRKILIFIPTMLLKVLLLILLIKILFVLYASMQNKLQKRKLWWLTFSMSLCGFLWYLQDQLLQKRIACVVKESAFVYAGPESSFHTIFQLKSGTCVQLLHHQSKMSLISVDGQSGWVVSDDIEIQ